MRVWELNVGGEMWVVWGEIEYEKRKVYIVEEIVGKGEEKEKKRGGLGGKVGLKV